MSNKIDAREVLKCLNDLGYTNINAQQLKEFIKDLKTLIKYEEKIDHVRIRTAQNKYKDAAEYNSSSNNIHSTRSTIDDGSCGARSDIFSSLYSQETVASEAKKIKKTKENVISVHIKRPDVVNKPVSHPHCVHGSFASEYGEETRSRSQSDSDLLGHFLTSEYDPTKLVPETSQDTVDIRPSSCPKTFRCSKPSLKPKSSFIRPRMCKTLKTDPVALYHQYQAEWKKQKIPGEDSRADLRWAIREKMLGGPTMMTFSTAPSMDTLGRRKCEACRI